MSAPAEAHRSDLPDQLDPVGGDRVVDGTERVAVELRLPADPVPRLGHAAEPTV
jgi:hypothetical protein